MISREFTKAMLALPSISCQHCGATPTPTAYIDDSEWHLYARCNCERLEIELPWPFFSQEYATPTDMACLGFIMPNSLIGGSP